MPPTGNLKQRTNALISAFNGLENFEHHALHRVLNCANNPSPISFKRLKIIEEVENFMETLSEVDESKPRILQGYLNSMNVALKQQDREEKESERKKKNKSKRKKKKAKENNPFRTAALLKLDPEDPSRSAGIAELLRSTNRLSIGKSYSSKFKNGSIAKKNVFERVAKKNS